MSCTVEYGQCGGQPVDLSQNSLEQKLEIYQKKEDALTAQLNRLQKERDDALAEVLISKQMLLDYKAMEAIEKKEITDELEELKAKLDKTEFIMQYKEEVWTYLEREIRKVVHKDSDLLKKVQKKTKILTDCLASTKVSTVVKQNSDLIGDHQKACKRLQKMIQILSQELM